MVEIEFKKIELKDKEVISHFFAHHTSRSCERTFTNVYLWARFYDVSFAVGKILWCLKVRMKKGVPLLIQRGNRNRSDVRLTY